jgi:hypothetical protein
VADLDPLALLEALAVDDRPWPRSDHSSGQSGQCDQKQDRLPASMAPQQAAAKAATQQAPGVRGHQIRLISTVVEERRPIRRPTR